MKVGVKFCGHCAPRMDMMEFYQELQARAPEVEFRYCSDGEPTDVLLVLNACQVECAGRPAFPGPVVVVSPEAVDHWPTPPERLCGAVLSRISAAAAGEPTAAP